MSALALTDLPYLRIELLEPSRQQQQSRPKVTAMTDERLEWHLWNWEQWQYRQKGSYGRGYPSRGLSGMGCSGSSDVDAMVQNADTRCATAVEAILSDLSPAERCAVHAVHLAAVFRMRDLQGAYDRATEAVRKGLTMRGIP